MGWKQRVVDGLLCAALATAGCGGDGGGAGTGGGSTGPPCDPPPARDPGAFFVDATDDLGITAEHHLATDFCEVTDTVGGPGVCLLDHDGDGDLDIFVPDRAGHPSHLLDNRGSSFVEVGDAVGLSQTDRDSMGCLAFDYDGDGDRDLYLANVGPDQLLRNDGGSFSDVSAQSGLDADGFSLSATAGDVDGDGDLDLFVSRIVQLATCAPGCSLSPGECDPERNLLFINEGGTFTEEGVGRGIDHPAPTLATVLFDHDLDGDLDLYVGNDIGKDYQDRFYVNDGSGIFDDKAVSEGLEGPGTDTMGVDLGDYDLNGTTDLVTSDFRDRPARLFRCPDPVLPCTFDPVPDSADYVKWTVIFEDFDRDRDLDLFIANGDVVDTLELARDNPSYLYFNDGAGDFAAQLPVMGSGFGAEGTSRGAAVGDLDGDGDPDLVIANAGGRLQVLMNDITGGYHLAVDLDSEAIGARVTVEGATGAIAEHAIVGGPYGGNHAPRLHFGLGDDCRADVTVRYLDGSEQVVAAEAFSTTVFER